MRSLTASWTSATSRRCSSSARRLSSSARRRASSALCSSVGGSRPLAPACFRMAPRPLMLDLSRGECFWAKSAVRHACGQLRWFTNDQSHHGRGGHARNMMTLEMIHTRHVHMRFHMRFPHEIFTDMHSPRIEPVITRLMSIYSTNWAIEALSPKINFSNQSFELSPVHFCQSCVNHHSRLTSLLFTFSGDFFFPQPCHGKKQFWQNNMGNCFLIFWPLFKLRRQTSWKAASQAVARGCVNQAFSLHFWTLLMSVFLFFPS